MPACSGPDRLRVTGFLKRSRRPATVSHPSAERTKIHRCAPVIRALAPQRHTPNPPRKATHVSPLGHSSPDRQTTRPIPVQLVEHVLVCSLG